MRNFGKSIGSKGWVMEAGHPTVRGGGVYEPRPNGCGMWTPLAFLGGVTDLLFRGEQPTWNCSRPGESNCLIET